MTDYATNIAAVNGQIPDYGQKVQVSGVTNVSPQYGNDKFVLNSNPVSGEANDVQAMKVREANEYMKNQKSLTDTQNLGNKTEAVKFMRTADGNVVPVFELTKDGKVLPRKSDSRAEVSSDKSENTPQTDKTSDSQPSRSDVSYEARYLEPGDDIKTAKDDPENHLYVPSTVPSKISNSSVQIESEAQRLLAKADLVEKNVINEMRHVC